MLRGEILDPSGVILIYDSWTLTPVMHEILEFGFDKSSTNKQIISGVVPGLRAAHAGVEDDSYPCHALVSAQPLCLQTCSRLLRGAAKGYIDVSFRPRSFDKVKV